ncbi:hypothetical protein ACTHQ6_10955 [Arthrobacter sp. SAFR-179]|uniref:hypothetical protein n=1 Tax=Arthrobacter sp. SAFR-179 TaxID=3387279 RepID=UPI003F7B4C4F
METTPPPDSRPAPPQTNSRNAPPAGTSPPSALQGHRDQPPPGAPGSNLPGNNLPGNNLPDNDGPGNKGTNSLVLAILAPASMILTAPASMFAMLMTYSDDGSSSRQWVTPLVLFSLPLLFASLSLRQAIPALKLSPRRSGNWTAAAVALCICGLVFALALGPALDNVGVF